MKKIKNIILIIITVLFLGGLVLKTASATCDPEKYPPDKFEEVAGVCVPINTGLSDKTVKEIVFNAMQWILGIFGFIALIAFAVSGIQYMTAAGNENAIETAKRNMKWSMVGVIIGLGGLVIVWAIDSLLFAKYYI